MTTEKQWLANRRNALNSTGPRSAEGKERVAQNALKHGLSSVRIVIEGEKRSDFKAFGARILNDLQPVGELEAVLAMRAVEQAWRLRRLLRIESEMFAADLSRERSGRALLPAGHGDGGPASVGELAMRRFGGVGSYDRFRRFEAHVERGLYRALHELDRVQARRKARKQLRSAD